MIATVKPHLYTRRLKSAGKFPVKLRVRFNRDKKFYAIGIDMTEKEFSEYHLSKKMKNLFDDITYYLKKANDIITELKDNFTWIAFEKLFYTNSLLQLEKELEKKEDVFKSFLAYHTVLKSEKRFQSAGTYNSTYNALKDYFKESVLPFEYITTDFLKRFDKKMRADGLSTSTVGIYMRNLRAIFNQAIEKKLVLQEHYPFGKNRYSPPTSKKAKKSLTIEEIGKIFAYKAESEIEDWAKDMWLFLYFGNGMNVKDMALLKYKNILKKEISFVRAKSQRSTDEEIEIKVIITDEMKSIISKWGNKNPSPNNYIFDIILKKDDSPEKIYLNVNLGIKLINKYIGKISEKLEIDKKPTTNSARHSFATVLKRAGVGIEMISENLGHTSIKTTEIYLGSFENEQRQEAIKHLSAFNKVIEEK